jgi:DNA-binding NtrC family response regulator
MARILIVDDDCSKAAFLKMILVQYEHTVLRCEEARDVSTFNGTADRIDLILVNLEHGVYRGWDIFFELKGRVPRIPVLLYVMEQLRHSAVKWIVNAVTDAVAEKNELCPADP